MEDEDLIDTFIGESDRALGFLCGRYGFEQPSAEVDRRSSTVTVTFAKANVGLEATFDVREGDVGLAIVRLDHGEKPDGYHIDSRGRRCRAGLVEILLKRGVRGFGLRGPGGTEGHQQRFHRVLAQYARLLEEHGADILSGSPDALDALTS